MSAPLTPPPSADVDTSPQILPETVRNRSYLTAGLAILLSFEVAAIGAYAYYRVQELLAPEKLADRVEEAVRENYPEFRQELVDQAHERAPEIAKRVSKSVIAAVPDARADMERLATRQLAIGLDKGTELSADQFREFLRKNEPQIVKIFESIEQAPEEAHRIVLETEASIEEQLGVDLQRQAKIAVQRLSELNTKLGRLAGKPEELTAREQLERRIVRVLRAMQQPESQGPSLTLSRARR